MTATKIHNYCNILPIACEKPKVIVRKDMRYLMSKYDYVVIAGQIFPTQDMIDRFMLPDIRHIHISEDNALNALKYVSNINGFGEYRGNEFYILETFWRLVPCGHCDICRSNKCSEWCSRVQLEMFDNPNAAFLTLTFDEEHLPKDKELHYEDFQKFLKRLRIKIQRQFGDCPPLRFVCCGEYGHLRHRCHYHTIIWNLPDLRKNPDETIPYFYRVKEFITPIWKNGLVDVGHYVSADTIRYITKYMLKDDEWALQHREVQPFFKASRNPGIGGLYFTETRIQDIKNADDLKLHISINGQCLDLAMCPYCTSKVYKSNSKVYLHRVSDSPVPESVTKGILDPYRLSFSKWIKIVDNMLSHRAAVAWLDTLIKVRSDVGYTLLEITDEFDEVNDPLHVFPFLANRRYYDGFAKDNSVIGVVDLDSSLDMLLDWRNRFNDVADTFEKYLTYFVLPASLDDIIDLYRHYQDRVTDINSFLADELCEGHIKECDLFVSRQIKNKKQTIHYLLNRGKDEQ